MPFVLRTWVGPRNHVLDGGSHRPMPRAIFRGKDMPGNARWHRAMSCAKMAEPIEIPFGLWTRVGPRQPVLGAVHTGATWRIPLKRPCAAAMRPSCQIALITCLSFFLVAAFAYTLSHSNDYSVSRCDHYICLLVSKPTDADTIGLRIHRVTVT